MKYAENNRISHRQLYHQIILSFLAPLLICIPGYNGEQGMSGTVGIMAAVLILLLYVFFLIRTSYCYADPVKIMGKLKAALPFSAVAMAAYSFSLKSRLRNTSGEMALTMMLLT